MLPPYGQSLALLTDLYQLTMASGYWREGLADREAVFLHSFRSAPFGGAFAVAAGLDTALGWLADLRFGDDDLSYLAGLTAAGGQPLFEPGFLDHLAGLEFACDVDAVPEGTVVFAGEPLVRVRGPLLQAQIVETALLTVINFQTLIATKAARVCLAAQGDPVLEFGLRRSQGVDGGLSASRAAYLGGCVATSNLLAGKLHGIPVRGTHAHSWVLAFDTEAEALAAFARSMPHNCVLLVDTYDSLEGVRAAIGVGRNLQREGFQLAGVRLDSGDLASLSATARELLDEAGLESVAIVASNDLDEHKIAELRSRGAKIGIWAVGTSIAAGGGQSALGGVYKLALLRDADGNWQRKAKRSEDPAKASTPGMLQIRRYADADGMQADLIYDELRPPSGSGTARHASTGALADGAVFEGPSEELLQPVLRGGRPTQAPVPLAASRERRQAQLDLLPERFRKLRPDAPFPVFLDEGLATGRD